MTRELDQLRRILDSNDPFMTGGHQIIKSAGATRHAERMLRVPSWAMDDNKIRELVKRCFPNPAQRDRAARMVRIIYLYYRTGLPATHIAEDLHLSLKAVKHIISRANKTMVRPAKPRGRPRKETNGENNNSVSL